MIKMIDIVPHHKPFSLWGNNHSTQHYCSHNR